MSLRTISDRIDERRIALRDLEQLAWEEVARIRTEWMPEQVSAQMPASLVIDVLSVSPQSSL
jgi:hypothetical protein